MEHQIEMALDDIIKANKTISRGGGAGRKFNTNKRAGGAPQGCGGEFRNGSTDGAIRGRYRGRVTKSKNYTRLNDNTWTQDMFNDFGKSKIQRSGGGDIKTTGRTKLLVSNLDFGVSDSDMLELFSEFGVLKSAAVHYDRTGRSLGTAGVVFEQRASALKAMKQYNGVLLDGRAMNIRLATSEIRRSGGRDKPRRDSRKGSGRVKRSVLTAEQLDAELDAYVQEKERKMEKQSTIDPISMSV